MSDLDAARYLLTDMENRRIFLEEIVPEQFAGRISQSRPTVVFLVGQPGAGKTNVGNMIGAILDKRGGFIDVDSDLYKPYHPSYDELMTRDDTLMAAYTRADGRIWMAQAHEYVREHKLNAVIQETSQNGQSVATTMRAYRQAGFRVEVMMMAVPQAMSNQGIINRYHEQVKDRGSGRLTVQANADESYQGILALADLIEDEHLADQVAVFRRGEDQPRYANSLNVDSQWQRPPALRESVIAQRTLAWTSQESADYLQVQGKLRTEMGAQWTPRLDHLDRDAATLLAPLTLMRTQDLAPLTDHVGRPTEAVLQEISRRRTLTPEQRQSEATARLELSASMDLPPSAEQDHIRAASLAAKGFPANTQSVVTDRGNRSAADPPQPPRQTRQHQPDLDRER